MCQSTSVSIHSSVCPSAQMCHQLQQQQTTTATLYKPNTELNGHISMPCIVVCLAGRCLLLGGHVSIAWWTGVYCLVAGFCCLADRYLLLGGQISIVWQMHLQDLDTYK